MATLSVDSARKDFGSGPVLVGTSLHVPAGRLVAVLGPSGSGKTTLLRLIAGFETLDSGTIAIDGVPVASPGMHVPPERRRVGYMTQEGALFPHLSVGRNIAFGLGRGRHERRVAELLDLVGLPAAYARRSPQQLSGGEQQRVALARALAPSPRLMLLDEPFSSLDASLRQDVRQAVAATLTGLDTTAILVTHDQREALSMGHRVAVLRAGRIVQHADPATLYHRPADLELAAFLGDTVVLPGIARGAHADTPLGPLELAAPCEGPVDVLIRPEQIRLAPDAAPGWIQAEISAVRYFGHDALVDLQVTGADRRSLTARVFSHALPRGSGTVSVAIEGVVPAFPTAPPSAVVALPSNRATTQLPESPDVKTPGAHARRYLAQPARFTTSMNVEVDDQ